VLYLLGGGHKVEDIDCVVGSMQALQVESYPLAVAAITNHTLRVLLYDRLTAVGVANEISRLWHEHPEVAEALDHRRSNKLEWPAAVGAVCGAHQVWCR
jgi:hypothetical protein